MGHQLFHTALMVYQTKHVRMDNVLIGCILTKLDWNLRISNFKIVIVIILRSLAISF